MYQKFKNRLLDEMEMKRDLLVMKFPKPIYEPIFEVSSFDDKLYQKILEEFDKIAVRHVEELLCDLCEKYNIVANKTNAINSFDLEMSINGQMCFIELKAKPYIYNSFTLKKFQSMVKNCQRPVYLIYLINKNVNILSINKLSHIQKLDELENFHIMFFEDFILNQFGKDELLLFQEAMVTYKHEMHQIIGYQITEILNPTNLEKLKKELEHDIVNFDYMRIRNERFKELKELYATKKIFNNLSNSNFDKIMNFYINKNRYKLLLGNSDFANSFMTSEWLMKKYFYLQEMDNTFIVAGYLKSIEQLLWKIIYYSGQGRSIKGVTIEKENEDSIDTTLGALQHFITNYQNDDLFENSYGNSTHFIMRYLQNQISMWRQQYRNGYFHKHTLQDKTKIHSIRDETFFLYFLLLGTLSLDDDMIRLLNN